MEEAEVEAAAEEGEGEEVETAEEGGVGVGVPAGGTLLSVLERECCCAEVEE